MTRSVARSLCDSWASCFCFEISVFTFSISARRSRSGPAICLLTTQWQPHYMMSAAAAINSLYRTVMLTTTWCYQQTVRHHLYLLSVFTIVGLRADYDGGIVNDVDDATIVMSERRLHGMVEWSVILKAVTHWAKIRQESIWLGTLYEVICRVLSLRQAFSRRACTRSVSHCERSRFIAKAKTFISNHCLWFYMTVAIIL